MTPLEPPLMIHLILLLQFLIWYLFPELNNPISITYVLPLEDTIGLNTFRTRPRCRLWKRWHQLKQLPPWCGSTPLPSPLHIRSSSRRIQDTVVGSSSPRTCFINSKVKTRWLHRENILCNTRETSLQRCVATRNGVVQHRMDLTLEGYKWYGVGRGGGGLGMAG